MTHLPRTHFSFQITSPRFLSNSRVRAVELIASKSELITLRRLLWSKLKSLFSHLHFLKRTTLLNGKYGKFSWSGLASFSSTAPRQVCQCRWLIREGQSRKLWDCSIGSRDKAKTRRRYFSILRPGKLKPSD